MSGGLWWAFGQVAAERGSVPAFIQGDQILSFDDLRDRAARCGSRLIAAGVRPGDRCLIWAANAPDVAAVLLGCWYAGAIVAIVNDEAPLHHVLHAAAVTRPTMALADQTCFAAVTGQLECPVLSIAEALEPGPIVDPVGAVAATDPASIFFTSGSTGKPKGVTQSHANLMAGARMVAAHLGLTASDRILCPVPWAFDYGYGQFLSTILHGIPQVLPSLQNQFALCEAIAGHRPTVLAALPALLSLLVRGVSPVRNIDVTSIRLITVTGGAVPKAVLAAIREIFPQSAVALNYGMTETYRSASLPMKAVDTRPDSVGFAYPGVVLTVVREDGQEAAPGEIGEIVHRGAGAFLGYWGDAEATARVLKPDPFWAVPGIGAPMAVFTGDLGSKDENGFLVIHGRRDRMIKSMGVRISPDEIETLIRGTGLVREVAVVGVPHGILGEIVVAVIVPMEAGRDPVADIRTAVRGAMSRSMMPRAFLIRDGLPLTPNGKTDFAAVRELARAEVKVWD